MKNDDAFNGLGHVIAIAMIAGAIAAVAMNPGKAAQLVGLLSVATEGHAW